MSGRMVDGQSGKPLAFAAVTVSLGEYELYYGNNPDPEDLKMIKLTIQ